MPLTIEPLYPLLGRRVQECRRAKGWTQAQLAAHLDPPATRASVANVESGKQRVLAHTLVQLAVALETTVNNLLAEQQAHIPPSSTAVLKALEDKLRIPSDEIRRLQTELGLDQGAV